MFIYDDSTAYIEFQLLRYQDLRQAFHVALTRGAPSAEIGSLPLGIYDGHFEYVSLFVVGGPLTGLLAVHKRARAELCPILPEPFPIAGGDSVDGLPDGPDAAIFVIEYVFLNCGYKIPLFPGFQFQIVFDALSSQHGLQAARKGSHADLRVDQLRIDKREILVFPVE
jgi:hypothetical protein